MIFASLRLALQQLPDPAFRQVLLRGLGVAVVIFLLLTLGFGYGITEIPSTGTGWLDSLIAVGSGVGLFFLKLLLFPLVLTAAIGLFLDDVAEAVERRYYPNEMPGKPLSTTASLLQTLRFLLVVLALNAALLPVYLLLLFFPPLKLALFFAVNGYLVSREYFELVASRYRPRAEVDALRRRYRGDLWLAGVVIVLLLTIPLVNLIVPIVATAFMVHIFKRLPRAA
ncbi:EI24 domain-containing protein [Ferrovibrio sp.]|uniref:EI24 domain-containing protein n=1 Tax=Ferrovibrio sp. TaxID=1917215 RepID=UPI003D0FAEAC